MYRIVLNILLSDGELNLVRVQHEMNLHFVPFIGLTIFGDGWSFKLNSLNWNVKDQCFVSSNDSGKLPTIGATLEGYVACGWEVVK